LLTRVWLAVPQATKWQSSALKLADTIGADRP